jgi:hypothetical protein
MQEPRDYTSIKVAQFSWTRLGGADPFLGVGQFLFMSLNRIKTELINFVIRDGKYR